MKLTKTRVQICTLSGLALCVGLSVKSTLAQGPGDPGGQGPQGRQGGPGGQGGAGGQGFNGRGGFGGGRGQMPFAFGTITGGDAAAQTITITSQFGGAAQTIQLANAAKIVTQTTVAAADLQVDDQIQVQGVPTAITASSITAGDMPTFLQGGGGRPGGGPGGPGTGNGGAAASANAATGNASATGKVTSTSPLTISLGSSVSLTIKMAANAKVTRITPLAFGKLKVGDRLMASGQTGADGTFTATGLAINMTVGGMGMGQGGPGGRGGFNGQSGPNGRGGPGGQGGPGGPGAQGDPGGQGPPQDPGGNPPASEHPAASAAN